MEFEKKIHGFVVVIRNVHLMERPNKTARHTRPEYR